MGGHGGLNILPQKRWNVYNYENREKVRRDEEEAAREEQLKREQSRKRDAEFRLERLRAARGLAPLIQAQAEEEPDESEPKPGDSGHINLFEGIKIFDPIVAPEKDGADGSKKKKMKKEDAGSRIVTPEDDKYRLGYGVAGKGVKLPWYLQKPNDDDVVDGETESSSGDRGEKKKSEKKTLEELREERVKRERREKERERVLRQEKRKRDRDVYGSSRFNSR